MNANTNGQRGLPGECLIEGSFMTQYSQGIIVKLLFMMKWEKDEINGLAGKMGDIIAFLICPGSNKKCFWGTGMSEFNDDC